MDHIIHPGRRSPRWFRHGFGSALVRVPVTADDGAMDESNKYRRLPDPARLEDAVEVKDETAVPDPLAGRDTERDFMLRYAG